MEEYTELCLDGVLNIQKKNYEEAISCFDKSIALKPDNYIAYRERGLAKCYYRDPKIEQLPDGPSFKRAFKLDEEIKKGNIIVFDPKEDFAKAIELNPNDYRAYFYMAEVSGKIEKANEYYDKAIKLNPHFLHAYYAKYSLNEEYRMWDIANATYAEMKRNNPESKIVYYNDYSYLDYSYKEYNCYMDIIKEIEKYDKNNK